MLIRCLLAFCLLYSGSAAACQYHDNRNFAAFGQFHPLAQRHLPSRPQAEFKVYHNRDIAVQTGDDRQLQLRYFLPLEYTHAKVSLVPSEAIRIDNLKPFNLIETRGNLDVTFRAEQPGTHSIVVALDAMIDNKPYSKLQRITITSG
ncbi:hypothetical protein [Alteromonas oceanisediminis]|uniref:hypothetical protein n=1 Tax=Alteromonas oceanisediminis TaxID=2836180 RepID=UPI001BDB35AB|nr:hypothetical protein [Alteromonas oceanisediminis]MBT0585952.1 hypothetical protein [Alteromonas oceanisediminis]